MSENIVEQVRSIEAEADRIVAEARQKAEELLMSVEKGIADLRAQHEQEFRSEADGMAAEVRGQTEARVEEINLKARAAAGRLDSLDERAAAKAVEFIVAQLRGDV
jgi:vacuolar-type H+-ATPase subunit H